MIGQIGYPGRKTTGRKQAEPSMIDDIEVHRKLYENITDDMLTKPAHELTAVEKDILQVVLRGPLGQELVERMDNLGG